MSEQGSDDMRFRLDTGCIIDTVENEVLSDVKIKNLLNKFQELAIIDLDTMEELQKENEELRKENNELKRDLEYYKTLAESLANKGSIRLNGWKND